MTWNVTVVDRLARSYAHGAHNPNPAAEQPVTRKTAKYSQLSAGYIFQPLGCECLGAMNSSASDFLADLRHRLARVTGERRTGEFLFQRISLTIQRFNAVALRGFISCFSVDIFVFNFSF